VLSGLDWEASGGFNIQRGTQGGAHPVAELLSQVRCIVPHCSIFAVYQRSKKEA
jgi:hypothetical protein